MAQANVQSIEGNVYFPDTVTINSTVYSSKPTTVALASGAALVLTLANSGTVYYLAQATANSTITLPAIAGSAGFNVKFISKSAGDGAGHTWAISAPTAVLLGYHDGVAAGIVGTLFGASTHLTYSAVAANTNAGDWAEFISDGAHYYVRARSTGTADGWAAS